MTWSAVTSGTSPLRTTISVTSGGSASSAARTASAVPRGSSWTANPAPGTTASRTDSVAGEMTTRGGRPVASAAASMT